MQLIEWVKETVAPKVFMKPAESILRNLGAKATQRSQVIEFMIVWRHPEVFLGRDQQRLCCLHCRVLPQI